MHAIHLARAAEGVAEVDFLFFEPGVAGQAVDAPHKRFVAHHVEVAAHRGAVQKLLQASGKVRVLGVQHLSRIQFADKGRTGCGALHDHEVLAGIGAKGRCLIARQAVALLEGGIEAIRHVGCPG